VTTPAAASSALAGDPVTIEFDVNDVGKQDVRDSGRALFARAGAPRSETTTKEDET
jgi:hypothetical protein